MLGRLQARADSASGAEISAIGALVARSLDCCDSLYAIAQRKQPPPEPPCTDVEQIRARLTAYEKSLAASGQCSPDSADDPAKEISHD